jgi:multidrug efflux pump subunit AcrB
VLGFSFSGNGQNQVLMFVKLKDWEERRRPEQKVKAVQDRAMGKFMQFKDALRLRLCAAGRVGIGHGDRFRRAPRWIRAGLGHETLMNSRNQLLGMSMQNPVLPKVRPNGLDDTPMYQIDIDQEKRAR